MKTIFINRSNELNAIQKLLISAEKKVMILLGDGGIGKTRFLQEVRTITGNKEFKKLGINTLIWWDFDEYIQKDRPDTYIKNKFLEAAGLMEKVPDPHNITYVEIAKRINASPKRKLLLFDTLEKLSDPRIKSGLFEIFSELNNSVLVFAGRPVKGNDGKKKAEFDDFVQKAQQIDPALEIVTIREFDRKSALEYVAQKAKQRRVFISSSDKAKLAELSHGVPILLDLATDYLANNIRIQNLIDKVSNFEIRLVEQINKLKTPLDLAVLVLSVINPLDEASFAKLLDIKNAETLFQKLRTLSFVKVLPDGQVILHDKMEDLIIKHIWSNNNYRPSIEFEEQVLRKAFEIFKQRDQELTVERRRLKKKIKAKNILPAESAYLNRELDRVTTIREVVTQKWVRYGMALDVQSLWSEYTRLIRDVRTGKKYEFIQKLVDEINNPVFPNREPYWKNLNPDQYYEHRFINARSKKDTGDLDNAIRELEEMLSEYGSDSGKRNNILNLLASAQTQTGLLEHLSHAVQNHIECLQTVKSNYEKSHDEKYLLDIANIENQIGYTYRLLEDDEANAYDQSIAHYLRGREAALEYKEYLDKKLKLKTHIEKTKREINTTKRILASINNGLGYVRGLQGLYDDAYYQINDAISIWRQTGDSRDIARAKTSEAILKRDEGRFEEAARLLNEALELPHAKDDHLILCRVYHHKGWNEWELAAKAGFETRAGLDFLERAYSSLRDSISALGVDAKYVRELSGIYHNISEMAWKLGQIYKKNGSQKVGKKMMNVAREYNHKALELSKASGNKRYLIDALVGEAQYDLDLRKLDKIDHYFNQVKVFEKQYPQFGLFYGRMYRLRGDALFLKKEYDKAFEMYGKAYPLIYQRKSGEGSYGFMEEQKILEEKMRKLSSELARHYYEYLRSTWATSEQNNKLVSWCDNQIYRLRMA
jgi:tetratricopeptide (TPR) repeat protein